MSTESRKFSAESSPECTAFKNVMKGDVNDWIFEIGNKSFKKKIQELNKNLKCQTNKKLKIKQYEKN